MALSERDVKTAARPEVGLRLFCRLTISVKHSYEMELFWWLFTIVLFAVGLIGTVLPVIPGTTIILAAAIIHRMMLGAEKSIGWHSIAILLLLTLATYALDFLSGYFGAKYFGATKWGMFGAVIGALVGIVFGIIGLFIGPVIGAITGEFIAGKRLIDAGRAGWGSLLGNLGGMIGKLVIALVMITIFLMAVPSPF
jgi:uncharacterized protein YqgC (DUF456 family)